MPLYRIRPLNNPYVPINVDYFDRKALEEQKRFDTTNEAWANMVNKNAANSYYDEEARQQYLQQQNQSFQDIIKKYSGNLAAATPDVLTAINQAQTNPYHNLNKTQMENILTQRKLQEKYGVDYIDQSQGLYDSLYSNGKWRDPSTIKAQALKADDYDTILEGMYSELSPVIREYTGDLGVAPGAPGYLQAVKTKLTTLSPAMLQKLANDPRVHQTFLANAATATQDTRQYANTGKTYKEVLGSPQGFANFFMGNLLDKVRDDRSYSKQFLSDKVYDQKQKIKRDQAKIDYEKKQISITGPLDNQNTGKAVFSPTERIVRKNELITNQINNIEKNDLADFKNAVNHSGINVEGNAPSDSDFFVKFYDTYVSNGVIDPAKVREAINNNYITNEAAALLMKTPENVMVKYNDIYKKTLDLKSEQLNNNIYINRKFNGTLDLLDTDVKHMIEIYIEKNKYGHVIPIDFFTASKFNRDHISLRGMNQTQIHSLHKTWKKFNKQFNTIIGKEKEVDYASSGMYSSNKDHSIMQVNKSVNAENGTVMDKLKNNFSDPLDYNNEGIIQGISKREGLSINDLQKILINDNTKMTVLNSNYTPGVNYAANNVIITYKTDKDGDFDVNGDYTKTINVPNLQYNNTNVIKKSIKDTYSSLAGSISSEPAYIQSNANELASMYGAEIIGDAGVTKLRTLSVNNPVTFNLSTDRGEQSVIFKENNDNTVTVSIPMVSYTTNNENNIVTNNATKILYFDKSDTNEFLVNAMTALGTISLNNDEMINYLSNYYSKDNTKIMVQK